MLEKLVSKLSVQPRRPTKPIEVDPEVKNYKPRSPIRIPSGDPYSVRQTGGAGNPVAEFYRTCRSLFNDDDDVLDEQMNEFDRLRRQIVVRVPDDGVILEIPIVSYNVIMLIVIACIVYLAIIDSLRRFLDRHLNREYPNLEDMQTCFTI